MRYFFKFNDNTGKSHVKEVQPQQARDIDKDTRIMMHSFFPDMFVGRTVYKVLEKDLESASITYHLTKQYANEKDFKPKLPKSADERGEISTEETGVLSGEE